jgi:transposase-like protein
MKKKVNHFTDDFKLMVVQEYLNTDHSQAELKKKYGFSGNNCISNWMRKFGMKTPDEQKIQLHQVMKKESEKTKQELELEAKIRELEKSLDYERLKTLALNTMIDIAERDLKISIRKKHGTKQ